MLDGYIRNGILTIKQSKKQELFVNWLYDKFIPIRTSLFIKKVVRVHPKTNLQSYSLRFFLKQF